MRTLTVLPQVALLSLLAAPVAASETRALGSHEHGVGTLNVAIEGAIVQMELRAPGADIVGFEHPAASSEDRKAIENAVAQLARPLDLFVLPDAAGCTVMQASAEFEVEGQHDDHATEHDAHAADHDDDHDQDEGHTEFHAEFAFSCNDPAAVTSIEFMYFDTFANARELDVQLVTEEGAEAFEVQRNAPRLDLSGMM